MQGQPNACTASARNWGTKVLRSRLPEHLHILGSPGTVPLLSVSSAFPKQMLKKLFSKEYTFQNKQSKYLACTLILIGIKTLLLKWMIFKYLLPIPTSIPNEGSLRIFLFGRVLDVCLQQQQENRTVTSWLPTISTIFNTIFNGVQPQTENHEDFRRQTEDNSPFPTEEQMQGNGTLANTHLNAC